MLGISFGEILIICAVGLLVIGPQRLPETARFLGHFFGRLQRQVNSVKADIRREMALEDMKRMKKEFDDSAREIGNTFDQAAMGKPMPESFSDSIMKPPAAADAADSPDSAPKAPSKKKAAAAKTASAPKSRSKRSAPASAPADDAAAAPDKPAEPGP